MKSSSNESILIQLREPQFSLNTYQNVRQTEKSHLCIFDRSNTQRIINVEVIGPIGQEGSKDISNSKDH